MRIVLAAVLSAYESTATGAGAEVARRRNITIRPEHGGRVRTRARERSPVPA